MGERYNGPSSEGLKPRRLFDLDAGADHGVAAMLLFAGQTQQLPSHQASIQSAAEMIWEVTSNFVPSSVVLDLAINKRVAYDQRIHHAGFEIYSSGAGYIITAGGIRTDFAYQAVLGPIEFAVGVPFHLLLHNQDQGAAVPTTLMSASLFGTNMQVADFIRIEGPYTEISHPDRDKAFATDDACISNLEADAEKANSDKCHRNFTSDHNICVRNGFACGTNIVVPEAIEDNCLKPPPGAPNSPWRFIDSARCPAYLGASRFFVVLYRMPCPVGNNQCQDKWWGFFEAIDVEGDRSFDDFVTMTIARNPPSLFDTIQLPHPIDSAFLGIYHSWRDELIEFAADAHQQNKKYNGVFRVSRIGGGGSDLEGDINDWPLADGSAIRADGKGRITIVSPGRVDGTGVKTKVEIDFTDWEHPKYVELPPQLP